MVNCINCLLEAFLSCQGELRLNRKKMATVYRKISGVTANYKIIYNMGLCFDLIMLTNLEQASLIVDLVYDNTNNGVGY